MRLQKKGNVGKEREVGVEAEREKREGHRGETNEKQFDLKRDTGGQSYSYSVTVLRYILYVATDGYVQN